MVRNATGIEEPHFFNSMTDAIRYARAIAIENRAEVIIFDNYSNILVTASYAKDPDRP